jgi:hypothetical protein
MVHFVWFLGRGGGGAKAVVPVVDGGADGAADSSNIVKSSSSMWRISALSRTCHGEEGDIREIGKKDEDHRRVL